jgi:radical SAM superfamily enzyme
LKVKNKNIARFFFFIMLDYKKRIYHAGNQGENRENIADYQKKIPPEMIIQQIRSDGESQRDKNR